MKVFISILIFLLTSSLTSWGQTTVLPDTNFRNFLIQKFPTVIDANKRLINANAATITGTLDCSNRKITNISGIEKFTKITRLLCTDNKLTMVDSVKNLSQLVYFDCHNNPLKSFSSISKLTNLKYLCFADCGLLSIPDLGNNTSLDSLNAYGNNLSEIIGLDKLVNLTYCNLYSNQLKVLPNLSSLQKLILLHCHNNKLTDISGLSDLVNLESLVAGNNLFTTIPNLSKLTKLTVLKVYGNNLKTNPNISNQTNLITYDISDNQVTKLPDFKTNLLLKNIICDTNLIDTIYDLSHLKFLESFRCNSNLLKSFPDLISSKNTLNELRIQYNSLTSIQNFSSYPLLTKLYIEYNQLTFEDLIPTKNYTQIDKLTTIPQNDIGTTLVINARETKNVVLSNGIDKNTKNNTYKWFKNGVLFKTTTIDSLLIENVQFSDSGTYTCQVTNLEFPLLTLNRKPIKLKVNNCLDLSLFVVKTSDYECNKGGSITIQPSSILGGTPPYRFTLTSSLNKEIITPNGNLFDHLYESNYTMTIKDSKSCFTYQDIQLNGKKPEDCETLVIAFEDNKSNYLSFEDKGTAKVYNKLGKLVNTFTTPANWEGTLEDGTIVPGFYIVELNGINYKVTVIK